MRRATRHPRRLPWLSLGVAVLLLVPFAIRYALVRYHLERSIDATEREQREWIARDRADGEAMKQWTEHVRNDVVGRRELTQPSSVPSSGPKAQHLGLPAATTRPSAD